MDNSITRHIPWVVWIIIIAILSFFPGDQLPDISFDWISIDTLAHLIIYMVLSVLILFGFRAWLKKSENQLNVSNLRLYSLVIIAGIALGYSVELIQGNYIYRRYFDIYDIVANFFGTIFGVFSYYWIGIKLIKI